MNANIFIKENMALPYVYNMIVADLNGNLISNDGEIGENEAAIAALLYQNANQVGEGMSLSEPKLISFSCNNHKAIVIRRFQYLIYCVLDKSIVIEQFLAEIDAMIDYKE